MRQTIFHDLGRMDYQTAWDLQRTLQTQQIAGERGNVLLFVEHPPVITIGRRGSGEDVVAPKRVLEARGIAVTETDRGGQVTYHGPGQLVAYPMIDLQAAPVLNLHDYMCGLEEAVIRLLARWDIKAIRMTGATGVWVGREKICAMGVRVRKWWTMHGLALNVTTDLNHFGMIVPCGIRDRGVCSLKSLLGERCPSMEEVKAALREELAGRLGLELRESSDLAQELEGMKKGAESE